MKRVLLALLFGVTAMSAQAAENPYANIHTVAIISTLGDGLVVKQDSDFAGEDRPDFVLHTGLDLDGFIVARIREAVAGRFTVVEPAADPGLLQKYGISPALQETMRSRLAQSPSAVPDALIVVHPDVNEVRSPPPFMGMTYRYDGVSLHHTRGFFGSFSNILSVQYAVTVIDTRTGVAFAGGAGLLPAMGIFNARPHPMLTCKKEIWPDFTEHPAPEQLRQVQAEVMAVVAMSLPNALQNALLSPAGNDTWLSDWQGQPLLCTHF